MTVTRMLPNTKFEEFNFTFREYIHTLWWWFVWDSLNNNVFQPFITLCRLLHYKKYGTFIAEQIELGRKGNRSGLLGPTDRLVFKVIRMIKN